MKLLLILLLTTIVTVANYAQWIVQNSNTINRLFSIHFADSTRGLSVGINGTLILTSNGGADWEVKNSNTIQHLRDCQWINTNIAFVVGDGGLIFKTTDSGGTFNLKNSGTIDQLFTVFFIDENNGWIGGWDNSGLTGFILSTIDGGENWTTENITIFGERIKDIYFIDLNRGWILGSGGTLLITNNGGNSWEEVNVTSPFSYQTESLIFVNDNVGFISGNCFSSDTCKVYFKTTDGGYNWEQRYLVAPNSPQEVFFISNDIGWLVGYGIIKTIDGGETWKKLNAPESELLHATYFVDENIGWAAGADGIILKTTNGGVTFVEDQNMTDKIDEYKLYQNYPNPFNPTTTIEFYLPNTSFVKLKIFDSLGKEVANLISESKPIGYHKIKFDASNLSSGIYYYKLNASDFIKTKKLLLIK